MSTENKSLEAMRIMEIEDQIDSHEESIEKCRKEIRACSSAFKRGDSTITRCASGWYLEYGGRSYCLRGIQTLRRAFEIAALFEAASSSKERDHIMRSLRG